MKKENPDILCIGSVLWDIIGRTSLHVPQGADVPGRITRLAGGVAMNIAMSLARLGLCPAVLTAIGYDAEGVELTSEAERLGVDCRYIHRTRDLQTDRYMAIEGANGLIAAIADARSLESAGEKILSPLADGRLGSSESPWGGLIVLDGNLTHDLLAAIANSALFGRADLRVASASAGKAARLEPLLPVKNATFYVNLEEAGIICQSTFDNARQAATGLLQRGAQRVLVTNGSDSAADGSTGLGLITARPRQVRVARITGAGDTFMAAHLAAELRGNNRETALNIALDAAATYVSGEIGS